MVRVERIAQGGGQLCGHLDQATVARPTAGVEQLPFPRFGQALPGAARFAFVRFVGAFVLVAAPVVQPLGQRRGNLLELGEKRVAELRVERGAQPSSPELKRNVSMAWRLNWLCRRSGRSTVTFQ